MAKITLANILSGFSLTRINDNFRQVEDAINNHVLGNSGDTLLGDLDVNGKRIYNLPAPAEDNHPARLKDVKNAIAGLAAQTANLINFEATASIPSNNVQGAIESVQRNLVERDVNVKRFGAVGDGSTDDTYAFQLAADYAAANGTSVFVPSGTYKLGKVRIKNGCKGLFSDDATLVASTASHEGVIELDGIFFSTAAVQDCVVSGFKINGNGIARRGVFAATAVGCSFFNNHIYNLSPTAPEGGIALHFGSSHNRVFSNKIEMPVGPDCVGVYCISRTVDQYSGWMNGSIATPTDIAAFNVIFANYIDSGSHGISLFGARFCNVYGNILRGQRDRSIILAPAASLNTVTGNTCLDFGSTGIHLAYGSNANVIANNLCNSLGSTGEAGIQAYVACSSNKVIGNTILCSSKYGVYLAIDATYNEVLDNKIQGNIQKAGVGIDSDWSGSLPAGAIYSRPNYGPPVAPRLNWPNGSTYANRIAGNQMDDLPAGVAAFSVAQIGSLSTNQDNIITGNVVNGSAPNHYLHVFEATPGNNFGHKVEGNKFKTENPLKLFMTRGRRHFKTCRGNDIFNGIVFVDIATTATPDVSSFDAVSTAGFTAPTVITDFTNGMDGQEITVRMSVFTTITNNGNIKLKGGVDATGANANDYMTFRRVQDAVWIETSRTF